MNKKKFWILIGFGFMFSLGSVFATPDIMEVMFGPAKAHEWIVDLGADKEAVGKEVFLSSVQPGFTENLGIGCFVNNQHISSSELKTKMASAKYTETATQTQKIFCEKILWGEYGKSLFEAPTQAPLIVRITKFLLRLTIVLSVTMILYNGVFWIVESSKGSEVKDAKNNLIYIFVGILLSLSSVALINLVSSLGMSSLNPNKVLDPLTQDCSFLQTKEDQWILNKCWQITFDQSCGEAKTHHNLYIQNNCVSTLSDIQLELKRNEWNNKNCNLVTLSLQCANLIPYRNQYVDKIYCPSLAIKVQERKNQKCSIFKPWCEQLNIDNDNFYNYWCK